MEEVGGLVVLWKKEVELEILCYSNSFIHGSVRGGLLSLSNYFFIEVYENPKNEKRK